MTIPIIFLIVWLGFLFAVTFITTIISKVKSGNQSSYSSKIDDVLQKKNDYGEQPLGLSAWMRGRGVISSDGHEVPRNQDLTCETNENHRHAPSSEPRYIVHEDPPEGYVILNGKRRKISDCKNL